MNDTPSDAPLAARPDRLARLLRPVIWIGGLVAVFAVLGFAVVPPVAKHYAVEMLGETLGREVSIERIAFNPFTLTAEVQGMKVMEAGGAGEGLAFDRLRANLQLESLVRGGPVLHELSLAGPRLNLVLEPEGRHNWSDVLARLAARPAREGETLFSVGNIRISDGSAAIDDRVRGLRHEIGQLQLGLPFISNLPVKVDVFVEPVLSATVDGNPLELSARSKPFTEDRATTLELALKDFDLSPWMAYLPFEAGFRLPSGLLTAQVEVSFAQHDDAKPTLALRGPLQINRLEVQDKAGAPMLKMAEFGVELADVQPFAGKWQFTRLRLVQPELDLVRLKNGEFNLMALLPPAEKKSPPKPAGGRGGKPAAAGDPASAPAQPAASAPVTDFLLSDARIRDGIVRFEDRSLTQPFAARIEALNLDLRDLANSGDLPADIRFEYATDAGEKATHEAKLRLVPFELEGTAALEAVKLARYAPYAALALPGGELRGGELGASLRYRVAAAEGGGTDIGAVVDTLALRDFALALKGQKEAAVSVPALDLREATVDVDARSVKVAELGLKGAQVSAVRLKSGELDLGDLLGKPPAAKSSAKPGEKAGGQGQPPQWAVTVDRLALEDAAVRVEDRTVPKPVVLAVDGIGLELENVSTLKEVATRLKLDSRVNRGGRLGATGEVTLAPLKAELKLDARSIDLLPLQPYVLARTRIAISRGKLSTRGTLNLETAADGGLRGRYRGDIGVANFASVDRANSTDFVRWRTLRLDRIDTRIAPFRLDVARIAIDDFYTRLILNEQGRLNLREFQGEQAGPAAGATAAATPAAGGQSPFQDEVGQPPAAGERAAAGRRTAELPPPGAAPPIRIGRIQFRRGNVAFSDRFIRPHFDVNLTGMGGTLTGLSSDPSTIAKLDLGGKVDNSAPVKVSGELNPFRQDRHLDITASVKDFELTGLSSYAGKYVGYGIARGKLSAEVNYKIEDRKLTATNQIFLDQLDFGDRVDSPDALDLPVKLAVALLKNRDGEIDLHLPVSGTLDDPQFSVFGLVVKALVNLIGKAITAPFALLGSALGGGEELSQLELAPGVATVGETEAKKLGTLAAALIDRPALRLDITGRADPTLDTDGLKHSLLQRAVRAQKLQSMVARGEEAPSIDDIEVSAEEYPELLKKAYREADFKKPRNFIGLTKDLPVAEMEQLMIANATVGDEDLRALAQRRAQAVKDWLSGEGQVPGERIFLLEPKVEAIGDGGQVVFALR